MSTVYILILAFCLFWGAAMIAQALSIIGDHLAALVQAMKDIEE